MTFLEFGINAVERGLVPDSITRRAMRNLFAARRCDYNLGKNVLI